MPENTNNSGLQLKEVEKKEAIGVLIVEDDKNTNSFLSEALEEEGQIEKTSYTSAKQAIAMLEQKKPDDPEIDLLITDIGLDDGENAGTRVAEAFRKKYPKSNIVFLTGNVYKLDDLYTPEQKIELNFETWAKPLNLAKLKQKINEIKTAREIKTETALKPQIM